LGELSIILFIAGVGAFSPVWTMMSCNFSFSGFFLMVSSSLLLFQVTKLMPKIFILDYIGKNTILFYFLSNALPALFGALWQKFFPGISCYFLIVIEVCIEIALVCFISVYINRFASFIMDARMLVVKKC
jgi:hypothetical protein